jgi:hypothetical protein
MDVIDTEIAFYKANRKSFIDQYEGKHLIIKGQQVIGIYPTRKQALDAGILLEAGTYIIEHPVDVSLQRSSIAAGIKQ